MSIFTNGLMVNAPYAPVTGKAFGNGLYTANVYEKSFNYTYDWRSSKWAGSKYMLLCDVARGKRQKITEYQSGRYKLIKEYILGIQNVFL